jgi:signal transduction histidine kinase
MEMIQVKQSYEQELLKTQLETKEETITILSKELHDNVGQLLNSAKLLIGVTERKLVNPPDTLIIADETLGKAINELRSLSKSLSKEWLQQFNFIENLETEIKRINASSILQIVLNKIDPIELDSDKQIILFRIVQEAIQNAIKHSGASTINIEIYRLNEKLVTSITDNGKGIDLNTHKGVGTLNIQHRAKLLGGDAVWESKENIGTTVTIQIKIGES